MIAKGWIAETAIVGSIFLVIFGLATLQLVRIFPSYFGHAPINMRTSSEASRKPSRAAPRVGNLQRWLFPTVVLHSLLSLTWEIDRHAVYGIFNSDVSLGFAVFSRLFLAPGVYSMYVEFLFLTLEGGQWKICCARKTVVWALLACEFVIDLIAYSACVIYNRFWIIQFKNFYMAALCLLGGILSFAALLHVKLVQDRVKASHSPEVRSKNRKTYLKLGIMGAVVIIMAILTLQGSVTYFMNKSATITEVLEPDPNVFSFVAQDYDVIIYILADIVLLNIAWIPLNKEFFGVKADRSSGKSRKSGTKTGLLSSAIGLKSSDPTAASADVNVGPAQSNDAI